MTLILHANVSCKTAMAGSNIAGNESAASETDPHIVCSTKVQHVAYLHWSENFRAATRCKCAFTYDGAVSVYYNGAGSNNRHEVT